MSVDLWYGEKPGNFAEQSVLVDMYNYLQTLPEHFTLMSSFHAGMSGEIDLMVLKPLCTFDCGIKALLEQDNRYQRWRLAF